MRAAARILAFELSTPISLTLYVTGHGLLRIGQPSITEVELLKQDSDSRAFYGAEPPVLCHNSPRQTQPKSCVFTTSTKNTVKTTITLEQTFRAFTPIYLQVFNLLAFSMGLSLADERRSQKQC